MNIYSNYSDEELVRLLATGDQAAFDALYNRYWEMLFNSAYIVTRDMAVSKDILQDVFVWLWEHRQSANITSPKAYLRAAVKFKVANWFRSGRIRENILNALSQEQAQNRPVTPDEQAELSELNRIIQKAIDTLPEKCREIYLLKRRENLSNQQIADTLQVSIKTVENQITIAQNKIRAALGLYLVVSFLTTL